MCYLGLGRCGLERVLLRSFGGLANFTQLLLSPLRLAPRLAELLLRLPEFALKPLQLALEATDLALDSFDPVKSRILRFGQDR